MALMCQGRLRFTTVEAAWQLDFPAYFGEELETLDEMAAQGLVTVYDDGIEVTARGWFLIRAVAMVCDHYLRSGSERTQFSRII